MSYTIDVYRNRISPIRRWQEFALYVSFFPQLVAGPIVRAEQFFSQLSPKPRLSAEDVNTGFSLIMRGLIKKLVFADFLAVYADTAFNFPGTVSTAEAWIGVYAFALQIYFDFSAYTDLARGIGRLLGFQLPENFRAPYAATSISDFWRRWHISLSSWLRDYLYIPLGGSRVSSFKTCRNILLLL